MVDITFLEVHLDGATLSTGSGSEGGLSVEPTDESPAEEESAGSRRWVAALVGLVFLSAVAYLVNRRLNEEEAVPELQD